MSKKIVIIGAGFSGLSAATHLAAKGFDVTILEKNESAGGRCSKFEADGFMFDMGPSWYWMPDVFDAYFNEFGKKTADYYELKRLDPSYKIFFKQEDSVDIPADLDQIYQLFESFEKGSGIKLQQFLVEAKYKYQTGMNDFVHRPSNSIFEFMDLQLLPVAFKLDLFKSLKAHVASFFKSDRIQKILEFPVYFLGALPAKTPALYSLMNYADIVLGTWYPMGGMYKIIEGMENLAREKGVKFEFNQEVKEIVIENNKVVEVKTETTSYPCDAVIASADYHHVEQQLLPQKFRKYNDAYWDKRLMAPSSLIFYLGIDKKLEQLLHHNLFFDQSFEKFGDDIYTSPKWPSEPLFYVCCPSVTDSTVAPVGKENLFILIPLAPDLEDTEEKREVCFHQVMDRLENLTGQSIREHIIYKKSFAHKDFMSRYHAFKGNAYGLANTLSQTAFLKPSMRNPTVKNLYYAGQLTVPGPGVPPSLISGKVAANELRKDIEGLVFK